MAWARKFGSGGSLRVLCSLGIVLLLALPASAVLSKSPPLNPGRSSATGTTASPVSGGGTPAFPREGAIATPLPVRSAPAVPGPGVVADTFDLTNNTTVVGNHPPPTNAYYPFGGTYVPETGTVWLTANFLVGFNGTHQTETNTLRQPGGSNYWDAAYDPVHGRLYATNWYANNVSVYNLTTRALVTQIPVGTDPSGIVLDSATGDMFVANYQSSNVSVISTTTDSLVATIPVGSSPQGVAIDPALNEVLVADSTSNNLTIIDTTTLRTNGSINIPGGGVYGSQPWDLAFDPANSTVWVGGTGNQNTVAVVDLLNRSVVAQVPVPGGGSWAILYSPYFNTVYVGTLYSITQVNATSYAVGNQTLAVAGPQAIVEDPTDHELYVGQTDVNSPYANVEVVDESTFTLIRTVSAGGPSMYSLLEDPLTHQFLSFAPYEGQILTLNETGPTDLGMIPLPGASRPMRAIYDPYDQEIWVVLANDREVVALSARNYTEVENISLAPWLGDPAGIAVDQANGTLFITQSNYADALVVNISNGTVVHRLTTGYSDTGLAFDPAVNELFLANEVGGNVTVFNASTYTQVGVVSVGSAPDDVTYDPQNGLVYVADNGSADVTIINGSTRAIVATLRVGAQPWEVAVDPVGGAVYVSNFGADNVSVIDGLTNKIAENLTVGSQPTGIAFNSTSGYVYVADNGSSALTVVRPCASSSCMSLVSFVAKPPSISIGNSTNLSVTLQYPVGNVSYVYTGLPTGCATANVSRLSCTPAVGGAFKVMVNATDQSGRKVSSSLYLDVSVPSPVVHSITVAPASIYLGNATNISVNATGGYGWLGYSYSGLPSGCSSVNASEFNCTPTAQGSFTIKVTVTNSYAATDSKTASLSVVLPPRPVILNYSATPASIYLGNLTNISVNASGGHGWLEYSFSGLPAGCSSSNVTSIACTPTTTGTYTVEVTVTNAYLRTLSDNLTLVIAPDPHPSVHDFLADPGMIYLGNSTNLTVEASGGYGWLEYAYAGLPTGCAGSNSSTIVCVPSVEGNFTVTVTVTNAFRETDNATASFSVWADPLPTIHSFSAAPSPLYLGLSVQFSVDATGGYGWLAYAYAGLPLPCGSANQSTLTCTPSTPGNYTVEVGVTNAFRVTSFENLSLRVVSDPAPEISTFVASPDPIHLGGATTFTVTAEVALGSLSYSYVSLPTGCHTLNASSLECTPSQVGTFTVTVIVESTYGQYAEANTSLKVTPPTPPTITSFTADPSSLYVGQTTELLVQASGQSLTFAYSGLPAGCTGGNAPQLNCTPSRSGTYSVQVTVTDSEGGSVNATLELEVLFPPTLTLVSFTTSNSSVPVGSAVHLTVSFVGSVGYVTIQYSHLPSGCSSTNSSGLNCTPTEVGTFNITVEVTDQLHRHVGGTVAVEVLSPSPPPANGGSTNLWIEYAAVGGVLAVAAAAAAILLLRRRRQEPPQLS
jgi:YVTN family beta-propeller protein